MTFVAKRSEIRPYIEFDLVRKTSSLPARLPLVDVVIGPAGFDLDRDLAVIAAKAMLMQFGYTTIDPRCSVSPYRGS